MRRSLAQLHLEASPANIALLELLNLDHKDKKKKESIAISYEKLQAILKLWQNIFL